MRLSHSPETWGCKVLRSQLDTRSTRNRAAPDEFLSTPVIPEKSGVWSSFEMTFSFNCAGTHLCNYLCRNCDFDVDVLHTCLPKKCITSEFNCTFALLWNYEFASSYYSLCLKFLFQHCTEKGRTQESVLTSLLEIPRNVELPVKILEGLRKQMKYFLNDVTLLWKRPK